MLNRRITKLLIFVCILFCIHAFSQAPQSTDNPDEKFDRCEMVFSVDQAIEAVKNEKEAFIIGGGMIYRQFYPLAGRLYLTLVHRDFDADVYFPEINYQEWAETSREDHFDEVNGFNYSYLNLSRK